MPTALVRLPYDIVSGAQVSFNFDVARNPSEGGISGRYAMRPVKREYMMSVSPKQSREMMSIVMSTYGALCAFAIRDYADNYQLTDEEIPHTGTVASLGRTWAPSTGSLSVFERILIPDETERSFVVKKNGTPVSFTFSDFGKVNISGLVDGDTVTATGDYMIPVIILDAPSTSIITNSNGQSIHKFSDIRMEQIFEAELIKAKITT